MYFLLLKCLCVSHGIFSIVDIFSDFISTAQIVWLFSQSVDPLVSGHFAVSAQDRIPARHVLLHSFVTAKLEGCMRSAARSGRFNPRKKPAALSEQQTPNTACCPVNVCRSECTTRCPLLLLRAVKSGGLLNIQGERDRERRLFQGS